MAAGLGTRMKSVRPKHLHDVLGRRLVDWVLLAALPLEPAPFVVVCSDETREELERTLPEGVSVVVQERPLGTGDAVASARPALEGSDGDLLVLSGDTPLLTTDLLEDLVAEHRRLEAAVTVLSFEPADPRSYGRVLRDGDGRLAGIVEAADATPEQLSVREVNSSIYVFALPGLWAALERLEPQNAQGELYLTDAVRGLVEAGARGAAYRAPRPEEVDGVNTRVELAAAAATLRDRIVTGHMLAGVTIVDPSTTWIEADVEIEADAVIQPFTVLRGRTRVGARRGGGPSRRRRRRRRRRARAGGAVLLPAAGNGPPRGRQGGDVRGGEGLDDRRRRQGSAPLLHRRRRDRRGNQHRGGRDHRELPRRALPREATDGHRPQRPHR